MQERYACDLGDLSKLALLRALAPRGRVGVLWCLNPHLTPRELANRDGAHREHLAGALTGLADAADPALARGLRRAWAAIGRGRPALPALARAARLADAHWHGEPLPRAGRLPERERWFARARAALADCALVCCDPDNGLAAPGSAAERTASPKHLRWSEVAALADDGHALLLYQHYARRPHAEQARELAAAAARVAGRPAWVLRWNPIVPRMYAVVAGRGLDADAVARVLDGPWTRRGAFALAACAG
jgi:hypothetical protein